MEPKGFEGKACIVPSEAYEAIVVVRKDYYRLKEVAR